MNEMLTQEEFDEIGDQLLTVFHEREMSARDAVRIMMMVSIESCIRAAPSLSVALAELTKLFVQGLAPAVEISLKAEVDYLFDTEEEEDEAV
tara:strand:- start:162 stop:437 length:276 start_codon:yes stop_codon:yes gene_type:complete